MPSASDHESVLGRIAEIAKKAAARPDVPASLKSVLAEIASLAGGGQRNDTPEPSDMPQTESQTI